MNIRNQLHDGTAVETSLSQEDKGHGPAFEEIWQDRLEKAKIRFADVPRTSCI